MYAENTVKQNAKQILCLFSACDHLKGIFRRPRLILAPAKWSFHSAPAIFSPSKGADWAKPPLCDQIVSKRVVCMQIHPGVNNGGRQRARVRVRLCMCAYSWRTTAHHSVSVQMLFQLGCFGAGWKDRELISRSVLLHCSSPFPHNATTAFCRAACRATESESDSVVCPTEAEIMFKEFIWTTL